jgi:hypothetical protein
MASPFIPIDRNCPIELPASLEGWLREDHLARFVVEVVEQLDLSAIEQAYRGRGLPAYPPFIYNVFDKWYLHLGRIDLESESPAVPLQQPYDPNRKGGHGGRAE